jgi:uncharacterized membrane protein YedE/YeeE
VTARAHPIAVAFLIGALFGAGLLVAGMVTPARIVGFLDPIGGWDPTLAFVMAGAVLVYMVSYRAIITTRAEPLFDGRFHLPTRRDLDARLLVGAAIFGVGWGLGGYCPGPGLVAAASGSRSGLLFVGAMIVGVIIHHWWQRSAIFRRSPANSHVEIAADNT